MRLTGADLGDYFHGDSAFGTRVFDFWAVDQAGNARRPITRRIIVPCVSHFRFCSDLLFSKYRELAHSGRIFSAERSRFRSFFMA